MIIDNRVPVVIIEPEYDRKLKKMSHRKRKAQQVLECGNASISFELFLTEELHTLLNTWWDEEYSLQGENFNVELFTDNETGMIEIRFFSELPFYKPRERHCDVVTDDIEANVLGCWEKLPAWIQSNVLGCYISDFDFIVPADYEY